MRKRKYFKNFLRCFVCLLLLHTAKTIAAPYSNVQKEKPNIIIILLDDMGWSNIGCYGGMVETPNIDKLADEGVKFSQFYSGARCCPTRASLMTGLHPHQTGVGHMCLPIKVTEDFEGNTKKSYFAKTTTDRAGIPYAYQGWLDTAVPTLPEILRTAGYSNYMVGKWHLASEKIETWPIQRGFDLYYGHLSGASDYFNPGDLYRGNNAIKPAGKNYYLTDADTDAAIEYLNEHDKTKKEEPFFLYLAYNAPHFPLQCMPEDYLKYQGKFMKGWDVLRNEKLERLKELELVSKETQLAERPSNIPAWNSLSSTQQEKMDAIMATYAAMIDRVDQNIGRVIGQLKANGELDNSIIFFLSDNGAEAESSALGEFDFEKLGKYGSGGYKFGKAWANYSNTPFREYKRYVHQGGIQTPLIVHWPNGIKSAQQGRVVRHVGFIPDIVRTCIDVAGSKPPRQWNGKKVPKSDGENLMKAINGSAKAIHRQAIVIEHEGKCMVRLGKWKLVKYFKKEWELYDISNDINELNDLSSQLPDKVAELQLAYDKWKQRVGAVEWRKAKNFSVYRKKK